MSSKESVGELKAIFAKQRIAQAIEHSKSRESPPTTSKHGAKHPSPNPGKSSTTHESSKELPKKPVKPPGQKHQTPSPVLPPKMPNMPGGRKTDERSTNRDSKAEAGSVFAGVLKNSSPKNARANVANSNSVAGGANKRPTLPKKPPGPPGSSHSPEHGRSRLKGSPSKGCSVDSFTSSDEDDSPSAHVQGKSPASGGGRLTQAPGRSPARDSLVESVSTRGKGVTAGGKLKRNSLSRSQEDLHKNQNQNSLKPLSGNVSQTCNALTSPACVRKPLTPVKPPPVSAVRSPHLAPQDQGATKSRSTSDLTSTESSMKHPLVPKVGGVKPSVGGAKPAVKPSSTGPKPMVSGTKPSLPGNKPSVKPSLPGNKPSLPSTAKPKVPASKPAKVSAANRPTPPPKVPLEDSTPKYQPTPPLKHSSPKQHPATPPKVNTASPRRRPLSQPPAPPPKVPADRSPMSPVKTRPQPPAKPRTVSEIHIDAGTGTAEYLSSQGSLAEHGHPGTRDRDDTLTFEPDTSVETVQDELERTVVMESDTAKSKSDSPERESGSRNAVPESDSDWVMVPTDKADASRPHRLPPSPPNKKRVTKATSLPGSAGSTPLSNKPLPSTPTQRPAKGSPVHAARDHTRNDLPKRTGKVSELAGMFADVPPSPSGKSSGDDKGLTSSGSEETGLKSGGSFVLPLPSDGPQIRISPSSFSRTLPATPKDQDHTQGRGFSEKGAELAGTDESGGRAREMSSNRGNVDSGFMSEVMDDLLRRGISVESLPGSTTSEDGGGVVSSPLTPDVIDVGDDGECEGVEPEKVVTEVWDEARLEKARKKRLNIAMELLETEKTYSGRIKAVAVDFYDVVKQYNVKSKQSIPDSAVQQVFLNLQQIYQLSETILQDLQERMDNWSTKEALGDVISYLAPFLKLYAHYTSGFEDAVKTLTDLTKRDRKFDSVVREFEQSSIGTGMGVASFMLEPVQRIPRYRLLLLDYLKYLPPDSPDRPPTESALRIISEAADHSNERIKDLEKSNVMLSIQRSLVDYSDTLVAPHRSFIKKGPLQKSSRKTLTPRYFFLFSDFLLHTSPEKDVYKFRDRLPIFGMKVEDPKVALAPFSFNIYSTTRSLIVVASCAEEKQSWIEALQSAINDDLKKRSSLRRDAHLQIHKASNLFGTKAPIMVPDKSVTMCQTCSAEFTVLFRRHHCRACGKVVCSNCSQQKAYLPYMAKIERVCALCFQESKNPDRMSGDECIDSPMGSPVVARKYDSLGSVTNSVLNVKGYEEDAVIAGYVLCQEGKKWVRMWLQIKRDCVLYKFKAHEDIKAVNSMPLPGYAVGADSALWTITLNHHSGMKNLCETFKVDDETAFQNWLDAIRKVIRMEFGDDPLPNPSTTAVMRGVTSPLTRSLNASLDHTGPSSRPMSEQSLTYARSSRTDSFSTVSSNSRPSSVREASPCVREASPGARDSSPGVGERDVTQSLPL